MKDSIKRTLKIANLLLLSEREISKTYVTRTPLQYKKEEKEEWAVMPAGVSTSTTKPISTHKTKKEALDASKEINERGEKSKAASETCIGNWITPEEGVQVAWEIKKKNNQ